MKTLKRNEKTFLYKAFKSKTEILKDGKRTGNFNYQYEQPVEYSGNISSPSGQVSQELFGIDKKYTRILVMDNPNLDIKEDGLIVCEVTTYTVVAVRPSLNVLRVALKECTVG